MEKRLHLRRMGSNGIIAAAALALIMSGIGYILWPQIAYYHSATPPATAWAQKSDRLPAGLGTIDRIQLPQLGIDLSVRKGSFDKRSSTWTLDDSHAFYMDGARSPLLYGHDMAGVFRNLGAIRPGDTLYVSAKSNRIYEFTYDHDKIVDPNDSSILSDHTNQLRLLTCSGALYQKRRVLYFNYAPQLSDQPALKNGLAL